MARSREEVSSDGDMLPREQQLKTNNSHSKPTASGNKHSHTDDTNIHLMADPKQQITKIDEERCTYRKRNGLAFVTGSTGIAIVFLALAIHLNNNNNSDCGSGSREKVQYTEKNGSRDQFTSETAPSLLSSILDIGGVYDESSTFLLRRKSGKVASSRRAEDATDEGDDGNADEDDQQNSNDRGPGHDDFFQDFLQDDLVSKDDTYYRTWDDFYYAYEVDTTPKLLPLDRRKTLGFFIAFLGLLLCASGGAGGGGVVVPIYILVVGLPIQAAIPIGAMTVLGGSLVATCMNWTRRHPLADRVLIDWDLILVMEPLILVGTLLGALFHRLLSEKLLVVFLVVLLSVTAHTTLTKAMRMYRAENRYIRHLKAAQADPPLSGSPTVVSIDETDSMLHITRPPVFDHIMKISSGEENPNNSENQKQSSRQKLGRDEKEEILIENPDYITLRSELMNEEKFTPRSKIMALFGMVSALTFLNIMAGGGAYESPWDIECGSIAFWIVHVIMIVFLVSSAWAAQTYVVARHEVKELVRFDYVHGDIRWDSRSAITYPAVFVCAGLCAGTLGIGGGVITVPMMLAMGVHPGVVSATSAAMVMFTSFASTTSFSIFGLVLPDFAFVGFAIGFTSSLVGNCIMRQAKQATSATGRTFERNSYTAFATGGVVLVSAVLMTIQYVFTIVYMPNDEAGLCDGLRF